MSSNNILTTTTSTEVTVSVVIVTILILLVICNLLMYTLTRMLTDPKFCLRQMVQRYTQKVPRVRVLEVHPKPRTPSLIGQSHADLISLLSHSANLQLDSIPRETSPTLQPDSASAEIIHFPTLQDDSFTREITPVYMKEETWKENMTITCEMQKVEFVQEEVMKQAKSDQKGDIQKMTGGTTLLTDSNLQPLRKQEDNNKLLHENQLKENPSQSLPLKSQILSLSKDNGIGVQAKVSKKGIRSLPKGGNSPNTTDATSEPVTAIKQDKGIQGQALPTEFNIVVRQKHDAKGTAEKEGCPDRVMDEEGCPDRVRNEEGCPDRVTDEEGCPDRVTDEEGCPDRVMDEEGCPDRLTDEEGCPDRVTDEEGCPDRLKKESDNGSETAGISTTSNTENCQESSDLTARLDAGLLPNTSAGINVGKISNPIKETKPNRKPDSNIGQQAGHNSDNQQILLINNYDTPVIKFFKEMKKEIVETTEEMMVNDGLVIDESEGTEGQTNEQSGQEQRKDRNQTEINNDIGINRVTGRNVCDGQIDRDNGRDEHVTNKNSSAAFENQENNDLNKQNTFYTEINGIHNSDEQNPVSSAKGNLMTRERTNTEYSSVSYNNEENRNNTQADTPDSGSANNEGRWEGKQIGTSSSEEDGDQNTTMKSPVETVEEQVSIHTKFERAVDTATLNEQQQIQTEKMRELQSSSENKTVTEILIKEETLSDITTKEDSKSSETDIEKDLNEYIRSNTMETNSDDRVNDKLNDKGEEVSVKDVKPRTNTKRSKQEPVTMKTQAVRTRNLTAIRNRKRFKQLKLAQ